jgi:dolichol-phosphate mannosyltransferase
MIKERAARDERIRGLRLSRSFGHQGALTAGLWAAEADLVITMDGDLQHPPETIPVLLAKSAEGFDVVFAVRSADDSESRFTVLRSRTFYWVLNRFAQLDLPNGVADFRCMSRRVVNVLVSMPERNRFLRGMTRWVGFRQTTVQYDRAARVAGTSKYTVGAMVRLAADAVISFSTIPLKLASVLGLVVALLGVAYGVFSVIDRFVARAVVPGYTTLVVAVLVLGGVQLACLGIIGQYLGRVYDESKGRPIFILWEDTRHPPGDEHDPARARARIADG